MVILAAALGVEAALSLEKDAPRRREFALVQYAKILHRLGGGTTWKTKRGDSQYVRKIESHTQSRGRVLRHLGAALDKCAELAVQHHVGDVLATLKELEAKGRMTLHTRPYPQRFEVVKRNTPVRIVDPVEPAQPRTIDAIETSAGPLTIVRM